MDAVVIPGATSTSETRVAWCLVVLVAAFGLLFRLDDRMLCPDEAETALLAQNVLKFGVPVADDGRNEITIFDGADWNEDRLYTWSPWIDEYISAASQAFLGRGAFAARLPFAILGLAAFVLFARTIWSATRSHAVALVAATLLATNVPFLLHARQCRYYAPLLFAQVWILWAFLQLLRGRRRVGTLHLGLALAMQYYGNFVVVPGNALALGLTALLLVRRDRRLLVSVVQAGLLFAALATPWIVSIGVGKQAGAISESSPAHSVPYQLTQVQHHLMPLCLLLLPVAWWIVRRARRTRRDEAPDRLPDEGRALLLLSSCVALLHLTVLAFSPLLFFRYLIPLMIVLPFLTATIVVRCVPGWPLRGALLALLVFTNWPGVATASISPSIYGPRQRELRTPYPDFVKSLLTPYEDAVQVVAEYLNAKADPEDELWSPAAEMALMYHTNLRVRDARTHDLDASDLPEWILVRSPSDTEQGEILLTEKLLKHYKAIELDTPAVCMGPRRPDPNFWRPFTPEPRETIVLLRRKRR